MSFLADLPILWKMVFPPLRKGSHAERLAGFYRSQAERYDEFRRRMLHGREDLMAALEFPEGGLWIDVGAGTGSNAELLGDRLGRLGRAVLLDLCPPLLDVARRRVAERGWTNVLPVEADATTWRSEEPADVVTFSYSLTMIPDWFRAVDRALENLKPGGRIGVVDFYVSRKWPAEGLRKHSRFQRFWWPQSYAWDDVFISPDHLPYLRSRFDEELRLERLAKVPYMLGLKSPHYVFVGRKR
jgi:S-adenosylmethionine-diacylgycerolhomoserine-N-methlytransferase